MTLEEAIKHCEEKAKELKEEAHSYSDDERYSGAEVDCLKCAKEHEQLAEWLTELKNMKDCIKTECFKCAKDKATIDNAPTVCGNNPKWCESCVSKGKCASTRPQGELKEYKPFEVDYNVKSAVENLRTAYWSNDAEKYAKAFTEADQMIVSAICHYGYIVVKGGAE